MRRSCQRPPNSRRVPGKSGIVLKSRSRSARSGREGREGRLMLGVIRFSRVTILCCSSYLANNNNIFTTQTYMKYHFIMLGTSIRIYKGESEDKHDLVTIED